MRAGRLLRLLLLLSAHGRLPAPAIAEALEVSVRTVYRDVDALAEAGVPVWKEPGRNGGCCLLPGYRPAWLPVLGSDVAKALVLTGVPAVAGDLGLDAGTAEDVLLAALPADAAAAARVLRDRLLIEPTPWFGSVEPVAHLPALARAVWEGRWVDVDYRSRSGAAPVRGAPLGLVLKGTTWYVLVRPAGGGDDRMLRVARVARVRVLARPVERPEGFDLAAAWAQRARAFLESIPVLPVAVRVSPEGRDLLHLLEEGTPPQPLPGDLPTDGAGWAELSLRFERVESAGRLLLRLGRHVEVLAPEELRTWMAAELAAAASAY